MTGQILLVSSQSKQAQIIQKFQSLADKQSGIYNHSGIIWESKYHRYVIEESQIVDRKIKAAAVITPISDYLSDEYNLLYLTPKIQVDERIMEGLILEYVGTPYDYISLLRNQVDRTLLNVWTGRRGAKAARKMVCHEYVQFIWHLYCQTVGIPDIFPQWWKGDVAATFHSDMFTHATL